MGILSDLFRFREAGEPANRNNVEEFGEPARSLFTSTEIFTLHHRIEITDESGNVVYRAQTQFPSLHDKTDITDVDGRQVAHIESKLFSLHERHFVDMADGTSFELSNELFHIINDITNIEGLGWQLRGDILALDFRLYDENDQLLANISQKFLSLHDKYCVDIYQPRYEAIIVAILVTLQHMIADREAAESASSSSSSSSD